MKSVHSKLFLWYLDTTLQKLNQNISPYTRPAHDNTVDGFVEKHIYDKLTADKFIKYLDHNKIGITPDGIIFCNNGGYKHQQKIISEAEWKTRTDLIKNSALIAAFVISIILNILYILGIITCHFSLFAFLNTNL